MTPDKRRSVVCVFCRLSVCQQAIEPRWPAAKHADYSIALTVYAKDALSNQSINLQQCDAYA
jgi:hypothetical protein